MTVSVLLRPPETQVNVPYTIAITGHAAKRKPFAIKALICVDRVNRSDAQITYVQYEKTRLNHASKETQINFLAMDPKENGIDELFGKKI